MNSVLISGHHGTPITLIQHSDYADWCQRQPENLCNWFNSSGFEGKGISLVAGACGTLEQVIVGVADLNDPFACGDLSQSLPSGDYTIVDMDEKALRLAAFGWSIGAYQFDRYKKNDKALATLVLPTDELLQSVEKQVRAISLVRDLINTPANDMMPQHLSGVTDSIAAEYGAEVTHLVGDELLQHNYPIIHAVGRASENQPRLIDLRWGESTHPKVTLVGKGVCFDSGGLDIKSAAGMRYMKKDMGGSAHVLGLASLIMSHQLPIRLRVLIPAVENAISNNAFRPGDVLTSRKGLTVEIDNTDAEGRLVLCDALTEASSESPEIIIDYATLTGACRVALGTDLPGFFTDDNELAAELYAVAEEVYDPVWRLPLHKAYKHHLESNVADLVNSPVIGLGGAITAGLYLQEFVTDSICWLHFDVMAWNIRKRTGRPIGGEAVAVRAVFGLLQRRYT